MRLDDSTGRTAFAMLSAPAAVLGTLAATLSAVPAAAHTEPAHLRPLGAQMPSGASAAAGAATSYTVRPGDTISAIAARFGLKTADVLRWNGLGWRTVILPGQTIRLTGSGSTGDETTGSSAPRPAADAGTHTVVRGDTVYGIAQKHGTTANAILTANDIGSSAIIYPGQKLTIPGRGSASAGSPASGSTPQTSTTLDAEQIENARLIIRIGRELGVSDRGIAIALSAAMVESWMRNLDWGDRDSLGLFQQRPSTGWGTRAQVMDRERAIRAFYGGSANPNPGRTRGLLDIPGWESMGFSQAAQAVQLSAFPDRYGQWEPAAYRWLELHG